MKQSIIITPVVYARRCDKTGEGMNSGWLFSDGDMYIKYEADVIAELRGPNWTDFWKDLKPPSERTDDEVLDVAFEQGLLCYTEWDPTEEDEWYTAHGVPLASFEMVNNYLQELPATDAEIAAVLMKMRGYTVWVREGDDIPGKWAGKQTVGIAVWRDDFSDSTGMELSDREVREWAAMHHQGMLTTEDEAEYMKIAKSPNDWRFLGWRSIYGEHGAKASKESTLSIS